MGIFSLINTGLQGVASWWSDRQAVKSTDVFIWFVIGTVAGYTMQPPAPERRPLPLPGVFLNEDAYENRDSYEQAVAQANYDWARFSKTMKNIKKKARKLEKEKKEKKKRDDRVDRAFQMAQLVHVDDTTSDELELEQQGAEDAVIV
ncbi:hypothetical protein GL218_01676 [Daldinia childiae]|uniref:uncharacterized protein n=1 Tax=Daldinia childiae TaxID=326645 RepID=UPI00144831D2|nr:uncharacterized protein GL218_01676 [Daldinia childiae]KAF3064773.1 hypothetical protein GL218_01676 [Daldinia childiae]